MMEFHPRQERILKTYLLAAIAATVAHASVAQPVGALGRLSGAQVVDRWIGPSAFDRTPTQLSDLRHVEGYLAGVADATEGTVWCNNHKTKTHEVDAEVVWSMKELPPEKLRTTVAAKLILDMLAKHFPCGGVAK